MLLHSTTTGAHACFMRPNHLNIMVESLVHLLYVQDNLGSNFGLETGYPTSGDSQPWSLKINIWDNIQITFENFLSHTSLFVICN
jgi:hypothetical protein